MSFYQDRQIRGYGLFLVCFSLCIVGMGLLLSMVQMELAKARDRKSTRLNSSHDN